MDCEETIKAHPAWQEAMAGPRPGSPEQAGRYAPSAIQSSTLAR